MAKAEARGTQHAPELREHAGIESAEVANDPTRRGLHAEFLRSSDRQSVQARQSAALASAPVASHSSDRDSEEIRDRDGSGDSGAPFCGCH